MRQHVVIALAASLLAGSPALAQNERGTAEAIINSQTVRSTTDGPTYTAGMFYP